MLLKLSLGPHMWEILHPGSSAQLQLCLAGPVTVQSTQVLADTHTLIILTHTRATHCSSCSTHHTIHMAHSHTRSHHTHTTQLCFTQYTWHIHTARVHSYIHTHKLSHLQPHTSHSLIYIWTFHLFSLGPQGSPSPTTTKQTAGPGSTAAAGHWKG